MDRPERVERLSNLLGLDINLMKPCDVSCSLRSEGCRLSYPFEVVDAGMGLHSSVLDVLDDIKMLYSLSFKLYWENVLGKKSDPNVLPCSHQGCRGNCEHLQDTRFMSHFYRKHNYKGNAAQNLIR